MKFKFNESNIETISQILKQKPDIFLDSWTWNVKDPDGHKPLIISIYNDVDISADQNGSIVSVQSRYGYYELHNIKYFLPFEPDELIFLTENQNCLSCLIIGKNSTCSLFSNINKDLLKLNFAEIHPAVLMAAMQLSITESVIEE